MAKKKASKVIVNEVDRSKVYQRNLADECEEYMKIFGANKNLYRIVPNLEDGLK